MRKSFQRQIQRAEHALERRARGQIRHRRRRAADMQSPDVQQQRLGRPAWRGRGALVENLVMRSEKLNVPSLFICTRTNGLARADFLEDPGMAEKRRELEIHINFIPGNERFAVLVLDEQARMLDGENANGLIFTYRMETSRSSCWEICFTATARMMGGRMRKPAIV